MPEQASKRTWLHVGEHAELLERLGPRRLLWLYFPGRPQGKRSDLGYYEGGGRFRRVGKAGPQLDLIEQPTYFQTFIADEDREDAELGPDAA